jgi:epoxyqueuosine reductase QueG
MKKEVEEFIKNYVKDYGRNNGIVTKWEEPLIAFADSTDELFNKLKDVANVNHALPSDLLADAKTVISYFIPFSREVVLSNYKGVNASREWALAYMETNQLIVDLNSALSEMLKDKGFESAVTPPTHNFEEESLVSSWSHKHIAYIAGLGRFGIHNMIITKRGCCGRLGSMVTNVKIEPTVREENELCLHKIKKSCGMCVKNCTFGALGFSSFDNHKCYKVCLENSKVYSKLGLADVCGKCIANVPCSFTNPNRISNER